MAKALQNFELSALHFSPQLLLMAGMVVVAAGLCVWLGGLRWAGLVAGIIGAGLGLICALTLADRAGPALIIAPLIAAATAAFFKRAAIILSGAGVIAIATWLLLAGGNLPPESVHGPSYAVPREGTLSLAETGAALAAESRFWGEMAVEAVKRMSPPGWAAGGAAAAIVVGAGFLLPRLTAAVTCASIGTMCIFAGMILVLLCKGGMPLTRIYSRAAFFGLVVLVMVAFGTLSQLLLCPTQRRKPQEKAEHKGGKRK